jgi:superoxide oxidase
MTWRNTGTRYGWLAILIHWTVVLLMIGLYGTIEWRGFLPKEDPLRAVLMTWHRSLGLLVLAFALMRLVSRAAASIPLVDPPAPAWQEKLSSLAHYTLYTMMIILPVTGYLMSNANDRTVTFFGIVLPRLIAADKPLAEALEGIHEVIGNIGYGLIGLHALAALWHHYVRRDNTLMLPAGVGGPDQWRSVPPR